jgi:hypothetical protein
VRAFLRERHPAGAADADFVTFGMATEYLRAFVDNEWLNQMIFSQHPTVSRSNRTGRAFMRAEPTEADERFRNQQRTLRIAELLFNLQNVEGIDARLEDLRLGRVESTFAELEAGAFLRRRGVRFRYINPSGTKGADYDAEIPLHETIKVNCEMKSKTEGTDLGEGAIRNPLQAARKQLPANEPGLVFLKVPEPWVQQPEEARILPTIIDAFLRGTSRVTAVVLRWEEQQLLRSADPLPVSSGTRLATEGSGPTCRTSANPSGGARNGRVGIVSGNRRTSNGEVKARRSNQTMQPTAGRR